MRRALAISLLAATVLVAGAAFAAFRPAAPLMTPTRDAVVKITTNTGHGSGVHVGNGMIMTSAHVVGDLKVVSIKIESGKIASARVLWTNKEYDVAALTTKMELPAAELNCAEMPVGADIEAVGNPLRAEFVSSFGKIAGKPREVEELDSVYVTDISVIGGMSGGPQFHNGKVVALTTAIMIAPLEAHGSYYPTAVGLGYAVPSSVVCKLLGRV